MYDISSVDSSAQEDRLLRSAQESNLSALLVTPSYGAECCILSERCEILTRAEWSPEW